MCSGKSLLTGLVAAMSRVASADIIASGAYLQSGFDATTLSAAQIRSILVEHGVAYPTNGTKPQLVQIFKESQPRFRRPFQAEKVVSLTHHAFARHSFYVSDATFTPSIKRNSASERDYFAL